LVERKKPLRGIVPVESACLLHVDFIPEKGKELFQLACEQDLEGVVGKWAQGRYQDDGRSTSWVKIKNPSYSQAEERGRGGASGRGHWS
jgi:bifunctional non-homologous end joining protein LigD